MKNKMGWEWAIIAVLCMMIVSLAPGAQAMVTDDEEENLDIHIDSHAIMSSKWHNVFMGDDHWDNDNIYINDCNRVLSGPMNYRNLNIIGNNYQLITVYDPQCFGEIKYEFKENSPLFYFYYGCEKDVRYHNYYEEDVNIEMALKITKSPEGMYWEDWGEPNGYTWGGYWGRGYSPDGITGVPDRDYWHIWNHHDHINSGKMTWDDIASIGSWANWKHSAMPSMNVFISAKSVNDDYTCDFYDAFIKKCKVGTFVGFMKSPTTVQRDYFACAYAAGIFIQKKTFYESFLYGEQICLQASDGKRPKPMAIFGDRSEDGMPAPTGNVRYYSIYHVSYVPVPPGHLDCYAGIWEGTPATLTIDHSQFTYNTNGAYVILDIGLASNNGGGGCTHTHDDLDCQGTITVKLKYKTPYMGGWKWELVDDPCSTSVWSNQKNQGFTDTWYIYYPDRVEEQSMTYYTNTPMSIYVPSSVLSNLGQTGDLGIFVYYDSLNNDDHLHTSIRYLEMGGYPC